jgi:site-specific DNA-methyltransferase (adenine-specific)
MTPYFEEDGITIYHGDCRDVLPSLEPVGLLLTDPPYNVGFDAFEATFDIDWWIDTLQTFSNVAFTPGIRNIWTYPKPTWVMCWAKPGSTRRNDTGGFNSWEPLLVYTDRKIMTDYVHLPDCVNHASDEASDHPCPKPLRLFQFAMKQLSDEGMLVLDPFMGSGTTLRAAKDLGRRAIGIEIEEKYCEIAAKRLSQKVFQF